MSRHHKRTGRTAERLDASLALLGGLLLLGSLAVWFEPLPRIEEALELDVAINAAATLVGAAVALLAWARWRGIGDIASLYAASAFAVLSTVNGLILAIAVTGDAERYGLAADRSGIAPVYLWSITRFVTAVLLVAGSVRSLMRRPPGMPAGFVAVGPGVATLLLAVLLLASQVGQGGGSDTALATTDGGETAGSTLVAATQVAVFGLFMIAALLFRRLYLRDALASHAYLSAGLLLAAFSQIHFALDPTVTIGTVTSSDVLRVGFHGVLLLGIQAELQGDLATLREKNAELRRLREADAARAALDERARLAREIHDGLAQGLWFAKMKLARLRRSEHLRGEDRATTEEVVRAVDTALADARQAVMALRNDVVAGSTLVEILREYVEDFSDRFGLRVGFEVIGDVPQPPARVQVEILRVVQEALNNVRKHADATLATVRMEQVNEGARVVVTDNGRGFDPERVPPNRYGLRSMKERAALVGGSVSLRSHASDGTQVVIDLPIAETR